MRQSTHKHDSAIKNNATNRHISEHHHLSFYVAVVQHSIKTVSMANRVFQTMEARGLDVLLLIIPCVIVLLFL